MGIWTNKPNTAGRPLFLPDYLRERCVATRRGWEIPLLGTEANKNLTEVIVAMSGLIDNQLAYDNGDEIGPEWVSFAAAPNKFEVTEFQHDYRIAIGHNDADNQYRGKRLALDEPVEIGERLEVSVDVFVDEGFREQDRFFMMQLFVQGNIDGTPTEQYPALGFETWLPEYWPDPETPIQRWKINHISWVDVDFDDNFKWNAWHTMTIRIEQGKYVQLIDNKVIYEAVLTSGFVAETLSHVGVRIFTFDTFDVLFDNIVVSR